MSIRVGGNVIGGNIGTDLLATKTDLNLSNSTAITNCITEIPQDIKLELNNGTLTLKAGSKVYVPNGFEEDGTTPKFDVVTIASDLTHSFTGTASRFAYYDSTNNTLRSALVSSAGSGTTPSGTELYYNTSTNNLDYLDNGIGRGYKASFPLCISNSDVSSIDQVFNGFGYIGSTVFALPGVKGLIPNGRNNDGSLKNALFTVSNVLTQTLNWTGSATIIVNATVLACNNSSIEKYDEKTNYTSYNDIHDFAFCGSCNLTNGTISNFKPKTLFHALDYNDGSIISGWNMPSSRYIDLTLGASGSTYTAPANGWFFLNKNIGNVAYYIRIAIEGYFDVWEGAGYATTPATILFPVKKGDVVTVSYNATGTTNYFRFIYAEGESSN